MNTPADAMTPVAFDPITLDVLRNVLEAVTREMGAVLALTAYSSDINERMNASCVLFDAEAPLIAQAEHVSVHSGSMMRAVASILAKNRAAGVSRRRGRENARSRSRSGSGSVAEYTRRHLGKLTPAASKTGGLPYKAKVRNGVEVEDDI